MIGLLVGIGLSYIGTDPVTNSSRATFGWNYLESGLQIMPVIAGVFALPEIIEWSHWKKKPVPKVLKIIDF